MESNPNNYHPITCLPTIYDLVTLICTEQIYHYLIDQGIPPTRAEGYQTKYKGMQGPPSPG
eukprot:13885081-Ditylum_brightwellii.AAC.1